MLDHVVALMRTFSRGWGRGLVLVVGIAAVALGGGRIAAAMAAVARAAAARVVAVTRTATQTAIATTVASTASSASTPGAPRCVPSRLNASAVLPGTNVSVAPLPGSLDASARTQISLLGVPAAQLVHVRASGSRSGAHSGSLRAYSQGDGASFVPVKPFLAGETVTVRGTIPSAAVHNFSFSFTVAVQDPIGHVAAAAEPAGKPNEVQHFRSVPELQPPAVWVLAQPAAQVAPGYVLATPYSGPGQDGPMIFDNSGALVWFDPLPSGTEATNLQVQQLEGHPVLTWWQGYIPPQGFGQGVEVIADGAYRQTQVRAGNGYQADLHDFQLTARNTALMTVFNPIRCDLSSVHGTRSGAVTDGVLQELDLHTGLVRREWHSVDHVALGESYSGLPSVSSGWPYDYFHLNSIAPAPAGTLLISARNTSALYELNEQTGQVQLSIGGRRPSVKMGPGTATAYQHDATVLPNGDISIFDNGAVPKVHSQSRGVLVSVNAQAHTDTLVAQFMHPHPLLAGSQGNIQALAGGNFFIGWGPVPYFSEFSAGGQLLYDARMPQGNQSYRAYRFPWTGTPANAPAVAVAGAPGSASGGAGELDVYASWNGATTVASWRVLGGGSPNNLAPVASAPRGGFETTIPTPGGQAYVAVQALDASGAVLGTSRSIKGG
ncbi:MAG TPA: arylsulfotransferase family protein [Solirubrobacteraceae bacterium]|jgi:hypothetical protein